jgi:phosphoribosylanthranilate isomerase
MLNLTHCTFTGLDEKTDLAEAAALSARHPFIEWGLLLSVTPKDKPRYPDLDFIYEVVSKREAWRARGIEGQFALHICYRDAISGFLNETGWAHRLATAGFERIQINIVDTGWDKSRIKAAMARQPDVIHITQHRAEQENELSLIALPNHAVLFDDSGGRGTVCSRFSKPLPGKHCGYAGGIGPHTIEDVLDAVTEAAGGAPVWIDMESKVRDTRDAFDLKACEKVAQAIAARLPEERTGT